MSTITKEKSIQCQKDQDVEYLSYLSTCIKEVYAGNHNQPNQLSERASSQGSSKRKIQELAAKYNTNMNSIASTPAGIRLLLEMKTCEELDSYCSVIGITNKDIESVLMAINETGVSMSHLSLLMSIGVWSQHMVEKIKRGEYVSEDQLNWATSAYSTFEKYDSFWEGAALALRISNNIVIKRDRGRKPLTENAKSIVIVANQEYFAKQ